MTHPWHMVGADDIGRVTVRRGDEERTARYARCPMCWEVERSLGSPTDSLRWQGGA